MRRQSRLPRVAVAVFVVWTLICLAVFAGVVYVAVHFIVKWW